MKNLITAVLGIIVLSGCSVVTNIEKPSPSENAYVDTGKTLEYVFKSELPADHKHSNSELPVPVEIKHNNEEINVPDMFKEHIKLELEARGFKVNDASPVNTIALTDYEVFSHRVSGFSPFVTLTFATVTAEIKGEKHRYTSFVKRAKLPVWTMDEITEPCFSEPLSLSIKTIVAQINRDFLNAKLSDNKVDELIKKIDANLDLGETYLDVYELGFSNNKKVLLKLQAMTKYEQEYIRLAAISSLGIMKDEGSVTLLTTIYDTSELWQDKAMAIKSLIDINNDESNAFVMKEYNKWVQERDSMSDPSDIPKKLKWNIRLFDKYKG